MTMNIRAVYENGILRPLQALELSENELVNLTIATRGTTDNLVDTEFLAECAKEADSSTTLESVREALAKIPGSMTADFVAERDDR